MRKLIQHAYNRKGKLCKKLQWVYSVYDGESPLKEDMLDIIYYNRKLDMECNAKKISDIAVKVLREEFSEKIEGVAFYNLLVYMLTNNICTMQSIKNVLSYKKDRNIKEIKDICFNNGEVQITCLI